MGTNKEGAFLREIQKAQGGSATYQRIEANARVER